MGKKNGFAKQIVEWKDAFIRATKETYMQYLADTMILVLNDHGFGEQRIRKILDEWGDYFDEYFDCLTSNPTADYARTRLDDRIRAICKSGQFVPFEQRYEYLPEIRYDMRK